MWPASSLWQVAALAACARLTAADDVPNHLDAPSPDVFLRRVHARAVVMGDYLYIDSGAVNKEGIEDDWSIGAPARAVASTLSIDITKSWSPESVVMKPTGKSRNQPKMHSGGLFVDNRGSGAFYGYGGIQGFVSNPPSRENLWKFRVDGQGGGAWITETPSNGNFFDNLARTDQGAWTSTSTAGFWIGGHSYDRTTNDPAKRGPTPGIISYNFTNNEWRNDSSADLSPDGSLYGASATFVPMFGPNGIIVVLGGTSRYEHDGEGQQPMNDIKFFDPVTKEVFSQKTTGPSPSSRRMHCAVGVEGPDNTFEIFLYAGTDTSDNNANHVDEIWILSLPGFFWTKADYPSEYPRVAHTCAVAGNRQLVSVGGFNNNNGLNFSAWWRVKDNFPQGLGIFDLTDLKWKDEFDPDADAYESPADVRAWYSDNDYEDKEWTNDDVKAFFASSNSETPGSDGDDSSPGSDNSDNTNDGNDESKDKDSVPVAAIAGGAVGGAIGVAIVAFLFWFCRRHRRKQEAMPKENHHAVQAHFDPSKSSQTQASEMFATPPGPPPNAGGWYSQPPVYPMQGGMHGTQGMQPVEADDVHKAELQGTSFVHEMDGSSGTRRQY